MILLISGGATAIFLFIWFIMRPQIPAIRKSVDLDTQTLPPANTVMPSVGNINAAPVVKKKPKVSATSAVMSLAVIFAERYGSFSNQANFKNLEDLIPLMTTEFARINNEYIAEQRKKNRNVSVYYGVSSKAVQNRLIGLDEQKASAKVQLTLQRRETKDSINSNVRVFYQDILISLVKVGEEWKVDDARWK